MNSTGLISRTGYVRHLLEKTPLLNYNYHDQVQLYVSSDYSQLEVSEDVSDVEIIAYCILLSFSLEGEGNGFAYTWKRRGIF